MARKQQTPIPIDKQTEKILHKLSTIPQDIFKGYFNPLKSLLLGASFTMIISKRSSGKSFGYLIIILMMWQKYRMPSVWIRRNADSFKASTVRRMFEKLWKMKIVPNKQKYDGIEFKNDCWCGYWINDKEKKIFDEPFCYSYALSRKASGKGTMDIPNIALIVFDEFMARGNYLRDEYIEFLNALSTIIRDADNTSPRIVLLGNPVSWSCPYFSEFGIKDVEKIPLDTQKIYVSDNSNSSLVLEMAGESQRNIKTDIVNDRYFGFGQGQVESIRSGSWEMPCYPHIDSSIEKKLLNSDIYFSFEERYFCIEIFEYNKRIIAHVRPANKPNKNHILYRPIQKGYVDTAPEVRYRFTPSDPIDKLVVGLKMDNMFLYSSNEIGEFTRLWWIEMCN